MNKSENKKAAVCASKSIVYFKKINNIDTHLINLYLKKRNKYLQHKNRERI